MSSEANSTGTRTEPLVTDLQNLTIQSETDSPQPPNQHAATHRYTTSPVYKNGNKLRDFQVAGLNWLIDAWHQKRNVILADEMGLGKIVQCLALLDHLHRAEHVNGPFLIVVPLSTVSQWQRECDRWTNLNCLVYREASDARRLIRETEWYTESKQIKFNVMLTTIEIVVQDVNELSSLPWVQVVVDEAHRLKNSSSKLMIALRALNCPRRLLLTGAPIQNNIQELFVLFNFLDPTRFSSAEAFAQSIGELQDAEQVPRFQELIRPYILRRMNTDVTNSNLPKAEPIIQTNTVSTDTSSQPDVNDPQFWSKLNSSSADVMDDDDDL